MGSKVVLVSGLLDMSDDRASWINDYLSLFEPALRSVLTDDVGSIRIDPDASDLAQALSADTIIGHELPVRFTRRLSQASVRYIDIRVSPVRFCCHDNLFAFGSNDPALRQALLDYRVCDQDLITEARSLTLSFRYRDLGQVTLGDDALVVFTEQHVDRDSIHFQNQAFLSDYRTDLQQLAGRYKSLHYVHRGNDDEQDPALLRSLGFRRCTANIYAVLSSRHVKAIAAIRSGILEEARYFGVPAIGLGSVTTPLMRDTDTAANDRFINVLPSDALFGGFWRRVLHGALGETFGAGRRLPSHNLMRRALNSWNSTATGLEFDGQSWRELVHQPLLRAIRQVRDEAEFRHQSLVDAEEETASLRGNWEWFTGEIVRIEAGGHVRSNDDYGRLERSPAGLTISWQRRRLIDTLVVAPGGGSFETRNQYGDGGTVRLVANA